MNTETDHAWFREQMATALADGLTGDDRARLDAHRAACAACAEDFAEMTQRDTDLAALFEDARPAPGFEDRLIRSLRDTKPPRTWVHPLVRRAAVGVAASLLLGSAGYVVVTASNDGTLPDLGVLVGRLKEPSALLRTENITGEVLDSDTDAPTTQPSSDRAWMSAEDYGYPPNAQSAFAIAADMDPPAMRSPESTEQLDRIRAEQNAAEAKSLVEHARTAQQAQRYGEAFDLYNRAQSLAPDDQQAAAGAREMSALTGRRGETLNRQAEGTRLAQQETEYTINTELANARQAARSKDFNGAQAAIERARTAANLNPSIFTEAENKKRREQIDQAQRGVNVEARGRSEAGEQASVQHELADARRREEADRSRTVEDLTANANRLINETRYAEAKGVVDQILVLDPKNNYASGVRPLVEDKAKNQQQRWYFEGGDRQATKQLNGAEAAKIPYDDILRYPSNWPALPELRGTRPAERGQTTAGKSAVVMGDGHTYWDKNPSGGVQQGKDDASKRGDESTKLGRTLDRFDRAEGKPALAEAFKPTQFGIEFKKGKPEQEVRLYDVKDLVTDVPNFSLQAGAGAKGAQPAAGQEGVPTAGTVVVAGEALQQVQQQAQQQPVPQAPPHVATSRKVIRTGAMEFEVDRFDAALAMITKLTQENGGYVGTTDSEKLQNGKVKGTVIVRVPPDRLDTLVLQLRGIGDLRSQKMDAQDVTKQYTDLEGELRAARAMEERLLEIIKTGKGEIKDLLAAEKELGVWRTKIEKMVGEMRYYDNLVALTTLTITAFERDIRTAALAKETETVDAGIETDDVEGARAAALKAIDEAKGRVVQSDLKRHDAGQFSAVVVAEVSPDQAGPLVDRLKQLGKVARFEVQRRQTTPDGTTQPAPGARLERSETRINLSLYNLANVAPRQTTNLNLAAADVEAAYKAIAARVEKAGGRVVTSNLSRPQAEQVVGTIHFEVRAADAEAVLGDVRALGEVMRLTVTENPDTNNVTTAKQGFVVQLASIAAVPARESTNLQIATPDVPAAYNALRDAVRTTPARVTTQQLNEAVRENVTAIIDFEVMRADLPAVEAVLPKLGDITQRTSGRSGDAENTVDSKVRMQVSFVDADQLPPRETTALGIETSDPDKALADLQSLASGAGGRVIQSTLSQERGGQTIGRLVVDVPLAKSVELITRAKAQGTVRMVQSTKDAQVPEGALARARVDMTFATSAGIVSPDQGLWASIRRGLATSMTGLMWSLQLIIIGLCFVGPWVIVIALIWKFFKRRRSPAVSAPVTAT